MFWTAFLCPRIQALPRSILLCGLGSDLNRVRPWGPLASGCQSAAANGRPQQKISGQGLAGVVLLSQRPQLLVGGPFLQL